MIEVTSNTRFSEFSALRNVKEEHLRNAHGRFVALPLSSADSQHTHHNTILFTSIKTSIGTVCFRLSLLEVVHFIWSDHDSVLSFFHPALSSSRNTVQVFQLPKSV